MNNKNVNKKIDKRKKDICFYCIFKEKGKTFQEQLNVVFQEYLENLQKDN